MGMRPIIERNQTKITPCTINIPVLPDINFADFPRDQKTEQNTISDS